MELHVNCGKCSILFDKAIDIRSPRAMHFINFKYETGPLLKIDKHVLVRAYAVQENLNLFNQIWYDRLKFR